MALGFVLHSAAVLAPGVSSLAELLASHAKRQPDIAEALVLPSPAVLPANERRRASQVVRLVLTCAAQALATGRYAPDELRCVFASDEGTGEVCQLMLEALVTCGQVSPLLFHNSVHNAPAGYFSIAYQNHLPAVSVSMGSESFAAGLLCAVSEACTSGQPVLFLAYDAPLPEPMRALLPIEQATANAWIIESVPETAGNHTTVHSQARLSLGRFELSLHAARECGDTEPSWLPAAWAANSSARAFEVLALLADGRGSCEFPLGAQHLRVVLLEGATAC
jgi:Beta-ketoacyl synthase, N-terminal domain